MRRGVVGRPQCAAGEIGAPALHKTLADLPAATALTAIGVDDVQALSHARSGTSAEWHEMATLATMICEQGPLLRGGDNTEAVSQLVYAASALGATDMANRLLEWSTRAGVTTLWATSDLTAMFAPARLRAHWAAVTAVGVSHDGTRAMSVAADGTDRLWQLDPDQIAQNTVPSSVVMTIRTGPAAQSRLATLFDASERVQTLGGGPHGDGPSPQVTAFAVAGSGRLGITIRLGQPWDPRRPRIAGILVLNPHTPRPSHHGRRRARRHGNARRRMSCGT
jgi:hypothetical protein